MFQYISKTITRKIFFGITLLISISLLVGFFSLWSVQKNKQRLASMFQQEVAGLEEADDIKSALYRIRTDSLEYVLAEQAATRAKLKKEIDQQQARLNKSFNKLHAIGLNKQEKKFIADIKHYSEQYISMLEDALYTAVKKNNLTQAEKIVRNDATNIMRLARTAANDFMIYSVQRAKKRQMNMEQEYTTFIWILFVAFLMLITTALLILFYFQRNIAFPITNMTQLMKKLTQCDWSVSVPIPMTNRTDELGGMAQAIEVFKENGLENERLHGIQIEKEKAESRIKVQSTFISNMSHEMRTPMNAILGFAQILEASKKEPLTEKQKKHVEYIKEGGSKLLHFIEQLLALDDIKDGAISFTKKDISIDILCNDCLLLIEEQAKKKNLILKSKLESGCDVQADEAYLKLVIYNLLSNAVKYNNEGGTVVLACNKNNANKIRFSVTDTGDGIAKDIQNEIFEPFNRLGKEGSNILGAGVGLTIAKQLTEAMGGNIGFDSEVGIGSVFWVDI